MKRSRTTALLLMSTAPLWLAACDREPDAREGVYTSIESCVAATNDRSTCQQAFDKAKTDAQAQAPRYANRAECVQEWGEQRCEQRSEGSHSFFMPLMTGFFLSQMMRGGSPMNGFTGGPAFQDNRGGWQRPTPGGSTPPSNGPTAAATPGNSAARGMTAISQPVNRAVTVSRGGFGRAGGARGSFGG